MKRTRGRLVQVETLQEFDQRLAAGAKTLRSWTVHGVDLRDRGPQLLSCRVAGATFLGCRFAPGDEEALASSGALSLPEVPDSPVDSYRPALYTADELYDAPNYRHSLDARVYAWATRNPNRHDTLAAALHDHAIDNAVRDWTADRQIVGVMGGHAQRRGDASYDQAAQLGRVLGARTVVATGGGPGAMEAANLGARFAHEPVELEISALEQIAKVPSFRPSIDEWVAVARSVLADLPFGVETLGIPTWFYGHEPPNLFATSIAKYVGNAQREAVLLEICNAGIVFLPGAAGTVQEVFQEACENYYADEASVAPMVLLGPDYWTETMPVWPLLQTLARGRTMEGHLHLVDSVEDAAALIVDSSPD